MFPLSPGVVPLYVCRQMTATKHHGSSPEGKVTPRFEKVGECLYRYVATGMYYAFLKQDGKKKRQSLETTELPHVGLTPKKWT
jgi:hypothetical protein